MVDMEVLVISVQSLSLSSRSNSHCQSGIENGLASVCVLGLAIEVMSGLVNEDIQQLGDHGIYKPFSCRL